MHLHVVGALLIVVRPIYKPSGFLWFNNPFDLSLPACNLNGFRKRRLYELNAVDQCCIKSRMADGLGHPVGLKMVAKHT